MADNTQLNAGTGGDVVASDDIRGVKHQRVKIEFGPDGSATDVSYANPLPSGLYSTTGGLTSSVRGSVNEKNALDIASTSALAHITVSAGSGTRYFGVTSTPGTASVLASGTSATGTLQALNYAWITVGFTMSGSAIGTLTLEGSHDGVTWFNFPMEAVSATGQVSANTSAAINIFGPTYTYHGPLISQYIRAKTTATVTGTYNMQLALTPAPLSKNNFVVSGTQTDADTATLASAVAVVSGQYLWTGANLYQRARTPYVFKTAYATASGSTAAWTPTSTKKFRLMRYKIDVPNSTIAASAGDLTISFLDAAAATNIVETITVPSTTTGGLGAWTSGWVDLGNGLLSATANNVLNVSLSFALTAGGVRVIVCGCEE